MKRKTLFAGISIFIALVVAALLFFPSQVASGATGCTCPTGCSTRTKITAPFSYGGAGEFCWEATELGAYVQSWGADIIQITGVDYTNKYAVTDQILRDTTGTYYVYYKSTGGYGNFSAVGNSGITNCHAAWCSVAQYGSINFPPFTMYNNVWGATSGSQMTWANSASSWGATANFPETSGVKSYPNASLDLNGKTLSNLGSCTSSFNVSVPPSGSWETAYDLWVPSEVMIWVNKNGLVGPIAESWNDDGTPVVSAANVTVGGHTWDVYHGGANVVSFVRRGNINSGTVDIQAILNWIADRGWISRTSNLGKFQFGFEITSAPGGLSFTTNSYAISCGGLGGGTVTPPPTTPPPTTPPPTTPPPTTPPPTTPPPTTPPPTTPPPTTPPPTTPPPGGACSPVNATITAPFTKDGAGTFCWQTTNLGTYINSWNMASLTINGVDYTNRYIFTSSLPAKINGYWYVSYKGNYAWSHFEAR